MKTIEALKALDLETSASVYLVGGYVRDMLRNVENNDLDVVVTGMPIFKIRRFLSKFGKVKEVTLAQTNDKFSVNILLFRAGDAAEAQISLARRGKHQIPDSHNTLKNDVKFRDFKVNSMYIPVNYKSRKDVIDYVGGRNNIARKIISANGSANERIKESPIRMMRAVSLASRTGYRLDAELEEAIRSNATLIDKCPSEVVRDEFNKIIMSKKPSKYIELLLKVGLLEIIAPEIFGTVGITQDKKFHKFDVFKHLIYTCNNCPKDLSIRLAGLLHDIGKTATRRESRESTERRITFHKHEVVSTKLAKTFMQRMKYDGDTAKEVIHLVQHHMYHYTREWTDAAVRKFIKKVDISKEYMSEEKISEFPLFRLRAAERKGNGLKNIAVTERQKDFEKRILSVYKESTGLEIKDLNINGHILMETFNLGPGEHIGEILTYLLEKVLEQPKLNEKLELMKLATEFIFNKREENG